MSDLLCVQRTGENGHITLVVNPLNVLMEDQMAAFTSQGISVAVLNTNKTATEKEGIGTSPWVS